MKSRDRASRMFSANATCSAFKIAARQHLAPVISGRPDEGIICMEAGVLAIVEAP